MFQWEQLCSLHFSLNSKSLCFLYSKLFINILIAAPYKVYSVILFLVAYLAFFHLINVSWCIFPWVYPVSYSLCFLYLTVYFLIIGKFLAIISSNIFSGPLLSLLLLGSLWCKCFPRDLSDCPHFFIIFLYFFPVAVITTLSSTSLIHFSASVILLLIPSSVFFISDVVLFVCFSLNFPFLY